MHRRKIAFAVIFIFYLQAAWGQSISPQGAFLQRKIKVGEVVQYALSVRYPKNTNILFPDSTHQIGKFEYLGRKYFNTKTDSTQSFDSVVYQLATFEIDTVQYLQLPIYKVENGDSTAIFSGLDSIMLIQIVDTIPKKIKLIANTDYVPVPQKFNYPYLLIGLVILLLTGVVIAVFFGKRIVKSFRIYRLSQRHKRFTKKYFALMRDTSSNNPANTPEHVLAVWKQYMERLERKPISKLTTKEILVLYPEEALKNTLKSIDRMIYGGEKNYDLFNNFDRLMNFSTTIFQQKIEHIKNS